MNATKAQTYTEMLLDTEAFDRHWARCYAQFKQVLQGLSAPSRRLVWQITYQYNDLEGMARVIAPGFTLAFERKVVGKRAAELKAWKAHVRTLLVQGELPELHIEQKRLRNCYDDPLASKVLGWSLEPLSAEARHVLRAALRPPVNALNFSVLLWPHFPFSMYGAANAATILELEQWQRTLKDQVSFNALGPMARKVLDTELVGS